MFHGMVTDHYKEVATVVLWCLNALIYECSSYEKKKKKALVYEL